MSTYQYIYKPLQSPAQIRILELLRSDEPSDPIHVKLHHVPLPEINKVEALSYEWGSPTRNVEVFCDGKALKITPNLFSALVRLRDRGPDPMYLAQEERVVLNVVPQEDFEQEGPLAGPVKPAASSRSGLWKRMIERSKTKSSRFSSSFQDAPLTAIPKLSSTQPSTVILNRSTRESYMLWIDAICINQADAAERYKQVQLMGSIYSAARHVVIWAGEELPNNQTREVYDLCWPLVNQFVDMPLFLPYFEHDTHPLESLVLEDGTRLGNINQHRLGPAMHDLFASRTVFRRLWTFQEVVLAREGQVTVQCGSVSIGWVAFYRIVSIIIQCPFLGSAIWLAQFPIMTNIAIRYGMQLKHKASGTDLLAAIGATSDYNVTDERVRIFGVLGLLDDTTREKLAQLSYQNSLGEILELVTKILVLESNSLAHFHRIFSVGDEEEQSGSPSWIWKFKKSRAGGTLIGLNDIETLQSFVNIPAVEFQGSGLIAWGLILDTVCFAYNNFSQQNTRQLLLEIYTNTNTPAPDSPNIPRLKNDRLWPLFSMNESRREPQSGYDYSEGYTAMMASLIMQEFGKWQHDSRSEINNGNLGCLPGKTVDLSDVRWRGRSLSEWSAEVFLADAGTHLDYVATMMMCGMPTEYGRNVFKSTRGYYGVGVQGKNYFGSKPAVQVGDKIAIFPQAIGPVILRPYRNDGAFRLVGPTFIPYILGDDSLRFDNRQSLQPIRIQ